MPTHSSDPGIAHRLRVVLPEPVGDASFRLLRYGLRELVAPTVIDRPGGTDDWLVIAFHRPAQVWVDGRTMQTAPADSLVVWRPDAPQRYGCESGPWLHSWMHVDGDLMRAGFDGGAFPLERPIPGIPTRLLDRLLLQMHTEVAGQAQADPAILRLHMQVWQIGLTRALAGGSTAPPGLLAARAAIESRYGEDLDLTELATIASCSRQHFCTSFRCAFGATPIQHLIRVRLRQAHLLLQDPAVGVADAASRVGFSDYRHFSRLYRRRFGHAARKLNR